MQFFLQFLNQFFRIFSIGSLCLKNLEKKVPFFLLFQIGILRTFLAQKWHFSSIKMLVENQSNPENHNLLWCENKPFGLTMKREGNCRCNSTESFAALPLSGIRATTMLLYYSRSKALVSHMSWDSGPALAAAAASFLSSLTWLLGTYFSSASVSLRLSAREHIKCCFISFFMRTTHG